MINDQLDGLREGQELLSKGQDLIAARLEQMNGTLRDVVVELGGAPTKLGRDPRRLSIRSRLHDLENGKHAAEIAGATLAAAKQLHESAAETKFSRREKTVGIAIAVVIASGPYLAPLLTHHHL